MIRVRVTPKVTILRKHKNYSVIFFHYIEIVLVHSANSFQEVLYQVIFNVSLNCDE